MPTVLSPEFKQISLPRANSEGEQVVRFDSETRTAEVSQEVADELVLLFPQSVVVLPDPPKPSTKAPKAGKSV